MKQVDRDNDGRSGFRTKCSLAWMGLIPDVWIGLGVEGEVGSRDKSKGRPFLGEVIEIIEHTKEPRGAALVPENG